MPLWDLHQKFTEVVCPGGPQSQGQGRTLKNQGAGDTDAKGNNVSCCSMFFMHVQYKLA